MKDNLTEIAVVLDRSGSMSDIWSDAVGGLETFISEQAAIVDNEANFSLVVFDHIIDTLVSNKNIKKVKKTILNEVIPRGSTSLYDAIGKTINEVGSKLAKMDDEDRPSSVLFVIITDGQENSSVEFTQNQIFDMISHQKDKYSWEFIFLAANQDAMKTGQSLGIGKNFNYTSNNTTVVFQKAASHTSAFRSLSKSGYDQYFNTNVDQDEMDLTKK